MQRNKAQAFSLPKNNPFLPPSRIFPNGQFGWKKLLHERRIGQTGERLACRTPKVWRKCMSFCLGNVVVSIRAYWNPKTATPIPRNYTEDGRQGWCNEGSFENSWSTSVIALWIIEIFGFFRNGFVCLGTTFSDRVEEKSNHNWYCLRKHMKLGW
jgi:hypothetical protein